MRASAACAFVIGAPFQSGILATGARRAPRTPTTRRRPPEIARAGRADRGGLRSATACRWPRPRSSSRWATRPSRRSSRARRNPAQVTRNVETFRHPIPAELWAELKHEGLLREDAPVPACGDRCGPRSPASALWTWRLRTWTSTGEDGSVVRADGAAARGRARLHGRRDDDHDDRPPGRPPITRRRHPARPDATSSRRWRRRSSPTPARYRVEAATSSTTSR